MKFEDRLKPNAGAETSMSIAIREAGEWIGESAKESVLVAQQEKKFQLGDIVKWTSQAGGRTREKEGEIVLVLQSGQSVPEGSRGCRYDSYPRFHENYLIRVPKKGLYRPRVSQLELVRHPEITA